MNIGITYDPHGRVTTIAIPGDDFGPQPGYMLVDEADFDFSAYDRYRGRGFYVDLSGEAPALKLRSVEKLEVIGDPLVGSPITLKGSRDFNVRIDKAYVKLVNGELTLTFDDPGVYQVGDPLMAEDLEAGFAGFLLEVKHGGD